MKKVLLIFLVGVMLLSNIPFGVLAEGVTIIGGENNNSEVSFGGEQELKPGDKIKVDGEYSIEFASAQISGVNSIQNGSYYVYLTSKENGAEKVRFEHTVGTHTPGQVKVTITNRSKQSTNWLKRVKCTIIFDDLYTFETLATQYNPDQVSSDGSKVRSTDAVDAEPLMAMDISFVFAVPYIVRDSSKPLVAYVSVDNDTYAIDLRKNMVIDND